MRYTGFDGNGIPRVYADHDNADVAETMCREEIMTYVQRRRDTGPLSAWTVKPGQAGPPPAAAS